MLKPGRYVAAFEGFRQSTSDPEARQLFAVSCETDGTRITVAHVGDRADGLRVVSPGTCLLGNRKLAAQVGARADNLAVYAYANPCCEPKDIWVAGGVAVSGVGSDPAPYYTPAAYYTALGHNVTNTYVTLPGSTSNPDLIVTMMNYFPPYNPPLLIDFYRNWLMRGGKRLVLYIPFKDTTEYGYTEYPLWSSYALSTPGSPYAVKNLNDLLIGLGMTMRGYVISGSFSYYWNNSGDLTGTSLRAGWAYPTDLDHPLLDGIDEVIPTGTYYRGGFPTIETSKVESSSYPGGAVTERTGFGRVRKDGEFTVEDWDGDVLAYSTENGGTDLIPVIAREAFPDEPTSEVVLVGINMMTAPAVFSGGDSAITGGAIPTQTEIDRCLLFWDNVLNKDVPTP